MNLFEQLEKLRTESDEAYSLESRMLRLECFMDTVSNAFHEYRVEQARTGEILYIKGQHDILNELNQFPEFMPDGRCYFCNAEKDQVVHALSCLRYRAKQENR